MKKNDNKDFNLIFDNLKSDILKQYSYVLFVREGFSRDYIKIIIDESSLKFYRRGIYMYIEFDYSDLYSYLLLNSLFFKFFSYSVKSISSSKKRISINLFDYCVQHEKYRGYVI